MRAFKAFIKPFEAPRVKTYAISVSLTIKRHEATLTPPEFVTKSTIK